MYLKYFENLYNSNIWIPIKSSLEEHSPKMKNYLDFIAINNSLNSKKNVFDTVLSVPYLQGTVDEKIESAFRMINHAYEQDIGLKQDIMIRSAYDFEDTPKYRSFGIGESRRVLNKESIKENLEEIIAVENRVLNKYLHKQGIREHKLGLFVCNTIKPKYKKEPLYSGSVKTISTDLMVLGINKGFNFLENENKFPNLRIYYENKNNKWYKKFEKYDSNNKISIGTGLQKKIIKYMDELINSQKVFPEGVDLEFVILNKFSKLNVVQFSPVKYMNEIKFSDANFKYNYENNSENSVIVGSAEKHFNYENIFVYNPYPQNEVGFNKHRKELYNFNRKKTKGYLLFHVDSHMTGLDYSDIYNVDAVINLDAHTYPLSDHFCSLKRKKNIPLAFPNKYPDDELTKILIDLSVKNYSSLKNGVSIQVDEREQVFRFDFGNVFKKKD